MAADLATKTDIAAVTLVAELADGKRAIVPYLFLPTGALERSKNAKAYAEWIASGAIISTDGSASDFQALEDTIRQLCRDYPVEEVLFDPWQAAHMMQNLEADGIKIVEFAQTPKNFSPAMTDFEADLMNGNIVHNDNPCLNWMAANASVVHKGNLRKIEKPTAQDHLKIDGMQAALMAYAASNKTPPPEPQDVDFFVLD